MSSASNAQFGNASPGDAPPEAEVASSVGNSINITEAVAEAALDVANDASPPTYAPEEEEEEEVSIEDVYNPHNLTMDELEKFLYEWEEEAAPYVTEYFDARTMHKLRTGETDDNAEEEEEDTVVEEAAAESESNGWMHRLRSKMTYDDGSKTKVEFEKGPTKYLKLSDDAAHVVEFYAPWYESIIVHLRFQMQSMHADLFTRVILMWI
jgi:hypothetical protein